MGASRGYTPLHLSAEDVCGTYNRSGAGRTSAPRARTILRAATAAQASRRGLLAAVTSADLESLPPHLWRKDLDESSTSVGSIGATR